MSSQFRAVIFDLDGVLADSEPWWDKIDAQLLAENGARYAGEFHREVLGVSYQVAVEFYKKAFRLEVSTAEMIKRRGEIATGFFAHYIGLFPHAHKILLKLKEQHLPLAIATSSLSASARPFLDRHQLSAFFEVIVTGEEVERGKPSPDIYLRAAEQLGVDASDCLVIEDALSGIAAAKSAEMRVAAIPDARFVAVEPYHQVADYLLRDLSEIPALVQREAGFATR